MDDEFPKAAFSPEHRPGLEALSKAGTDAALFGGQAVYFWADRYLAKHPELADLGPFTSKDTDALIVDAGMLERLKPWGKVIRSSSPADGQLAIFTPKVKDSAPVDLFTTVYGFSANRSQALIAESQLLHGSLRVLHPVDLLIAKAYNIAGLPQEGRNDARHLRIMVIVIRAFFEELLQQLERDAGEITARDVLWEIKRLFRLANHRAIRAILRPKLRRMIPMAEFRRCRNPQIVKFCGQSLEGYLESGE